MDAETHAKYAKTMLKQYNLTKVKLSEKSIAECGLGGIVGIFLALFLTTLPFSTDYMGYYQPFLTTLPQTLPE